MMYATKIKMKRGCGNSNSTLEIDEIYIEGAKEEKFYKKANVHNAVKNNPGCIKVKLGKNPDLIPCVSSNQEKYVRSEPNDTPNDNLLKLPRY